MDLTCVPELLVAVHREDDQQVAQDVDHDGEDEEAAQSCGDPGRAVQDGVTGVRRRAVQVRPIYNHCTRSLNFPQRTPDLTCRGSPAAPHHAADLSDAGGGELSPPTGFIFISSSSSSPRSRRGSPPRVLL